MTVYQWLCLLGAPALIAAVFKYLHSLVKKNALSKACSPAFTAAVSRAFFLTRECRYLKTAAMSAGAPRRQSH